MTYQMRRKQRLPLSLSLPQPLQQAVVLEVGMEQFPQSQQTLLLPACTALQSSGRVLGTRHS